MSVGILGSLGLTAFFPVWYHVVCIPKHDPLNPLPRSASVRGAYINSGSKDVGPEKDVPRSPRRLVEDE
jgi:hypothetical protein